jgi:hypothetical protein
VTTASGLARCFYPNCVLEEHETGDHKFGRPEKPWGDLRQLQAFDAVLTAGGCVRCDYCASDQKVLRHWSKASVWRAVAFYADMLGFGWALCADCARGFTTTEVTEEHGEKHEQKVAETRISRRAHADAPATYHAVESAKKSAEAEAPATSQSKVIPFRPGANSQKLKAGVS